MLLKSKKKFCSKNGWFFGALPRKFLMRKFLMWRIRLYWVWSNRRCKKCFFEKVALKNLEKLEIETCIQTQYKLTNHQNFKIRNDVKNSLFSSPNIRYSTLSRNYTQIKNFPSSITLWTVLITSERVQGRFRNWSRFIFFENKKCTWPNIQCICQMFYLANARADAIIFMYIMWYNFITYTFSLI